MEPDSTPRDFDYNYNGPQDGDMGYKHTCWWRVLNVYRNQ